MLRALLKFADGHHDLRGPDGKVATDALRTLRLWTKPKRKKTIVRDMLAWRAAVEALPKEAMRDLLMALALSGLRKSEWREARWHQLDLPRGVLRLPDPKSRVDTEIPLSSGRAGDTGAAATRRRGAGAMHRRLTPPSSPTAA